MLQNKNIVKRVFSIHTLLKQLEKAILQSESLTYRIALFKKVYFFLITHISKRQGILL